MFDYGPNWTKDAFQKIAYEGDLEKKTSKKGLQHFFSPPATAVVALNGYYIMSTKPLRPRTSATANKQVMSCSYTYIQLRSGLFFEESLGRDLLEEFLMVHCYSPHSNFSERRSVKFVQPCTTNHIVDLVHKLIK